MLDVVLPIDGQFEHMLPDRIVRIIDTSKEAEVELISELSTRTTRLSGHVLGVLVRKLLLRAATLFDDFLLDAVIDVVIGLVLMMMMIHVIRLGLRVIVLRIMKAMVLPFSL